MPFIPHTETEIQAMLETIGADSIEALFDEIPAALRSAGLQQVPLRASEMQVTRLMTQRASQDGTPLCFMGAGAYEHHIPAAIWQLTTRGEYYTAYTPYQAEASQGTLQLLYEFQSMLTQLTALDVSNASLYDGASALAEAVLMAVRANRKSKSRRILIADSLHPAYRKVTHSIVTNQKITLETLAFDNRNGTTSINDLPAEPGDFAALVIPQPNFFGQLEQVDELTDWAHRHGALVIAQVNPTALALLSAPGEWGENGADIACGEGQPLGIPLSSGGPYFGFLCCTQALVRQMPGRIIGKTVDLDGKEGYALTLQAREQHIRRSKATSNICTNQGLMTTAATMYMALLGTHGLEQVAAHSMHNTALLVEKLCTIKGVERLFQGPIFHECALRLPVAADTVLQQLAQRNILGGYALEQDYSDLSNTILVCATETKTEQDLDDFANALRQSIENPA
ncbi:MAG: aminomethyl-transferring glycine dehydrogenase subunit GcvPA [Gammaproteobacteria bacterium]|nr:aminomethyl-transferring glycine dehydrogenase subunit GcvPA [Gammaproteobacteria bacterium]MDH5802059.1 aminomethyl-transferring glycine dehydrogenase subunit GcvPA [Gammaproteobacteria bacterium]